MIQFVDPSIGGRLVQRVTTRRLAVVSRIPDFLAGVNAEAAAAVVAKKAVLDAKKAGALWSTAKWEEFRCDGGRLQGRRGGGGADRATG